MALFRLRSARPTAGRLLAARRAAVTWWMAGQAEAARCDACNGELRWGEGYLMPGEEASLRWRAGCTPGLRRGAKWLVCAGCVREGWGK